MHHSACIVLISKNLQRFFILFTLQEKNNAKNIGCYLDYFWFFPLLFQCAKTEVPNLSGLVAWGDGVCGGTFMRASTRPCKRGCARTNGTVIVYATQMGSQAPTRCSGDASAHECCDANVSGDVLAVTIAPACHVASSSGGVLVDVSTRLTLTTLLTPARPHDTRMRGVHSWQR